MGEAKGNPYVPFQINYRNTSEPVVDGFTPLNLPVTPCSKALNVSINL